MAKSKEQKNVIKATVQQSLEKYSAAFVAQYGGISTQELTKLRVNLRKVGGRLCVAKNRVTKKAIQDGYESSQGLSEFLSGQVGVIYTNDVAATAKEILSFSKENKKFVVKGGIVDSKTTSKEEIKALSMLPSKDVLMGQIVGSLVSPHRGLMYALNGVSSNLVRVISAIKDLKS